MEGTLLELSFCLVEATKKGLEAAGVEVAKEGLKEGGRAFFSQTTQQIMNSWTKLLSAISGTGASFLTTNVGKAALNGSLAAFTTLGSVVLSRDKRRALAKGIPSIAISLIPGIGIPSAIALNLGTTLIVDQIYARIRESVEIPRVPVRQVEPEVQSIDHLMLELAEKLKKIKEKVPEIVPAPANGDSNGDPDPFGILTILKKFNLISKAYQMKSKKISSTNFSQELLAANEVIETYEKTTTKTTIELKNLLQNIEERLHRLLDQPKEDNIVQKERDENEKKMLLRHIIDSLNCIEKINDELRAKFEEMFELPGGLAEYEEGLQQEIETLNK